MTLKRFPFILMFLFSGCASVPKVVKEANFPRARWETKMSIHDLEKDKTQSANVTVLGEKAGNFRMEASAILGIPVASVVIGPEGFRCALYRQKLFYQGPLNEEALKPLLHFALSPVVLKNIAFDEPFQGGDWKCKTAEDHLLSECRSEKRHLAVLWSRNGEAKSVRIEAQGYQLDWLFDGPQTEVQFKPDTFRLEAPGGFRVIRL